MTKRKTDIERAPQSPIELAQEFAELNEHRKQLIDFAAADSTKVAYNRDWGLFEAWCSQRGFPSRPCAEEVLGAYLAKLHQDWLRPSTIQRKLAAIVRFHKAYGHDSPRKGTISEQMKGIRRRNADGKRHVPEKEAPPLTNRELAAIVRQMEAATAEHRALVLRDRAALLIGWACAMRRSEIAGLEFRDADLTSKGWQIWIRRSKTDQESKGIALALAPAEHDESLCPISALEAWLKERGDEPGALFWKSVEQKDHRTVAPQLQPGVPMPWNQVNRMIRRWSKAAKLVSSNGHPFSPHSLRAGFITEAISAGRPVADTKERSRHKSMEVFWKYVRVAMTFENNVQKGLL